VIEPLRVLKPAWVPIGILAGTALLVWLGKPLPATLAGLRTWGPAVVLVAAVALAWWFNRGRSLVVSASLLCGFAAFLNFPPKAIYTAVAILIPLNTLAAMIRPEQGARHGAAIPWLLLLALEAGLLWFIMKNPQLHSLVEHWLLRSPPLPLAGRLAFAAAFAAAVWRAWPEFTPAQVGNAGALAAFYLAMEWGAAAGAHAAFMTAAGLVLLAALIHESHRLAFRDQLTGLPSRRALEERLRSLHARYVIAMADVDHFKSFNDQHGHDIGDQVLKLVAGRLAEVGGGGTAYRYGGEEFCVIFPGLALKEAEAHLQAVRHSIEGYRMAVRREDRPKKAKEGEKLRGSVGEDSGPTKVLSVTVSIGFAAPADEQANPVHVVKAADQALYRAKQAGRNRVAR
jgi:diguanylate cyclase (GGDEF)-like protein